MGLVRHANRRIARPATISIDQRRYHDPASTISQATCILLWRWQIRHNTGNHLRGPVGVRQCYYIGHRRLPRFYEQTFAINTRQYGPAHHHHIIVRRFGYNRTLPNLSRNLQLLYRQSRIDYANASRQLLTTLYHSVANIGRAFGLRQKTSSFPISLDQPSVQQTAYSRQQ